MHDAVNDDADKVVISRLAWDMAQWEIHYLRGLFTSMIVEDTLHGRRVKRIRRAYEEACLRALRDPEFRTGRCDDSHKLCSRRGEQAAG